MSRRLLLLALLLLGCSADVEPPPNARIVVLAPATAQMLDALGLAGQVVGIGRFGPWPASVAERPVVGDFNRPNLERILELETSHVVTTRSAAGLDAHARLSSLGVEVIALETGSYDSVFVAIAALGERFDRQDAASQLASTIQASVDASAERFKPLGERRVLIVVGREPLFIAGPGSHLDALAGRVGGRNVFADLDQPYAQVSLEAALERAPEVIIDASGGGEAAERAWQRYPFVPAVAAGRVHVVEPASISIPGVELPAIAEQLGAWIHAP